MRMEPAMKKARVSSCIFCGILAVLTLSCSLPFSFLDLMTGENTQETESWQAEVDTLKTMTRSQPIPNFLVDPEVPPSGEVFDPNQLLVPLDHLSLRQGYILDFVYRYDGIGGRPFLYARKLSDPRFENFEEFSQANDDSSYLNFIECDDTPESYFQWVLLNLMGNQFYLYWHAGYIDAEIIASQDRLEALVEEMSGTEMGIPFTNAQKRQALKIDPAPVVKIGDETVTVQVVSFSKWSGFTRYIFTLSRSHPHQILNLETENLLEYDCGIMF